jgi:Protein of unknown function (DUF3800)
VAGASSEFSDYIVFVDESGSPTVSPIDPNHPVFVLVFCVINKWTYCDLIQPAVKRLKSEFFGHDMAVLHSHEIRKRSGEFKFLMYQNKRIAFLSQLDEIISGAKVAVIANVINKEALCDSGNATLNLYHIAMDSCLVGLSLFLNKRGQSGKLTHIIAESRGRNEDSDLRGAFDDMQKWMNSNMPPSSLTPFALQFAEKKINSAGLQLADLFGHPIGRNAINPEQANHAFEIVRRKIFNEIMRFP